MVLPYIGASVLTMLLFESFDVGWDARWTPMELRGSGNHASIELDEGDPVLRIDSTASASLWYRELAAKGVSGGEISWRWKVTEPLPAASDERTRAGDDYAARIFIVFDPLPFGPKTRALCYVWTSKEPVGSTYASPYFDHVATVAVESGAPRAGRWVTETRSYIDDFARFFGEPPPPPTGVAVMVDTDDTDESVTAWFDDILVR